MLKEQHHGCQQQHQLLLLLKLLKGHMQVAAWPAKWQSYSPSGLLRMWQVMLLRQQQQQ
jgi:hypothetical protein